MTRRKSDAIRTAASLWFAVAVLAALLAFPGGSSAAVDVPADPAPIFAVAGTPGSAGAFFPGTAAYDGSDLRGEPYALERGQNLLLTNLDTAEISNCHQMQSLKRRKNGKPLFFSKMLCAPGEETLIRTARLKPGEYAFVCSVHSSMFGLLEITD